MNGGRQAPAQVRLLGYGDRLFRGRGSGGRGFDSLESRFEFCRGCSTSPPWRGAFRGSRSSAARNGANRLQSVQHRGRSSERSEDFRLGALRTLPTGASATSTRVRTVDRLESAPTVTSWRDRSQVRRGIAQLAERVAHNHDVAGSSPAASTTSWPGSSEESGGLITVRRTARTRPLATRFNP